MKGIFLRIDPKLDRQLNQFCIREGYKKSGLIAKLIREFLEGKREDPIQRAKNFGIDITLLEDNLKKNPTERLREHASFHESAEKIRGIANK
jgi:hypothetical protein